MTALAFQFASTNLVWELGLLLWVLIGWQFTLAEYVGGIVMIALMSVLLRRFVSPRLEERAREHAQRAAADHQHPAAGLEGMSLRERLTSASAWSSVAHNFRGDWAMLWKEIIVGFLLAGFIALLGDDFFNFLFIEDAPAAVKTIENVIAGPIIAVLSFVCSVGTSPSRRCCGRGDLVRRRDGLHLRRPDRPAHHRRLPQVLRNGVRAQDHRADVRDHGVGGADRGRVFSVLGLIPETRPTRADIFGSIELNYKLVLNVIGLFVFVILFGLTMRRGPQEAPAHAH